MSCQHFTMGCYACQWLLLHFVQLLERMTTIIVQFAGAGGGKMAGPGKDARARLAVILLSDRHIPDSACDVGGLVRHGLDQRLHPFFPQALGGPHDAEPVKQRAVPAENGRADG